MKNKKLGITASLICVTLGIALTIAGRLMGGYPGFYIDRSGVHASGTQHTAKPVQDSITLDKFDSMEIHADYADVKLIPSDEFAVEYCVRGNNGNPVCEIKNGRLYFQEATRSQSFNLGFFTASMGIAIHEPQYYIKVKIPKSTKLSEAIFDIDSGDLDISSIQADSLKITDSYGDVYMDACKSQSLAIQMESGTLTLGTIDAPKAALNNEYGKLEISQATGESLTIRMESGDLKADKLIYSDMEITSDYGRAVIDDVSGKRLAIRMESGDCQIGRLDCSDTNITSDYGDISLGLPGAIDGYDLDLKTEYGDIRMDGRQKGYDSDEYDAVYTGTGDGERTITAACESGDIELESVK